MSGLRRFWLVLGSIGFLFLVGCAPANALVLPTLQPTAAWPTFYTPTPTSVGTLPPTFTAVPEWQPTITPTATTTPTPTATPDPLEAYTVPYLASRAYGGAGSLRIEEEMLQTADFTRYLITYPSDGLTIYGFMNVPKTPGPHPVVLVLHGYWPTDEYNTVSYTAPYANAFAEAGFITIHPNYRNHPPSSTGPNLFRVGYAVDVLNLLAYVQQGAGRDGPLATADGQPVHLFGHSMGGGIALRVLVASGQVESAVLYGAMSGDEQRNFEKIVSWSNGADGGSELETPLEALPSISPINYLGQITARISVHHGAQDTVVPPEWSSELCQQLQLLLKPVECFIYPGQPHNFTGASNQLLIERAIAFFQAAP